jgi:hypothetical protein
VLNEELAAELIALAAEDQRVRAELLADRLARAERVPPPRDRAEYQRRYEQWLREVGWRK